MTDDTGPSRRPRDAEARDAERRADDLARRGAPAAQIDAADDEAERLHQRSTA